MGKEQFWFDNDDEEQLEYIRQWYEMKEEEKKKKIERKSIRNLHLNFAKGYFKAAVEELFLCIKCCIGIDYKKKEGKEDGGCKVDQTHNRHV